MYVCIRTYIFTYMYTFTCIHMYINIYMNPRIMEIASSVPSFFAGLMPFACLLCVA